MISTFAGGGTPAQFSSPKGVVVDSFGNLYVADSDNHRIRKIPSDRGLTTFAGSDTGAPGQAEGTAASFDSPFGVAVVGSGDARRIYVADTDNHTIRRITPAGVVDLFAGIADTAGSADTDRDDEGNPVVAKFNSPSGVAVDSDGSFYVADTGNHLIRKITITGAVATVTTLAGSGTAGADNDDGTAAQFRYPEGVAVDSSGILYVADTDNNTIRKIE